MKEDLRLKRENEELRKKAVALFEPVSICFIENIAYRRQIC